MKLPPKKKGISASFLKLIAYNPIGGLRHIGEVKKAKKRARGGRAYNRDDAGRFASGGAVEHMAEGGAPAYEPPDVGGPPPYEPPETKGGWTDYVPAAIKDVPHEMYEGAAKPIRAIGDAWTNIRERHAHQALKDNGPNGSFFDPSGIANVARDVGDVGSSVANTAAVIPNALLGAPRSLIGHPLAQAEHIVGTILNPKVAEKDDPAKMYEAAKGDVDLAMSAARPVGSPIKAMPSVAAPRGPYEIPANRPSYEWDIPPNAQAAPPAPPTPAEAASERLGVPISRAAVSESPTVQSAAGALKEVPFVGTPLVKSAKATLTGLDDAAHSTAAGYGSGDVVTAGEAAKEGIENWITGKSGDIAKRVYDRVDSMVDPNFERPLHATAQTVSEIMARRANSKISGASPAVSEVQEAITAPGMNYDGIKGLRTYIRDMTPQEMTAKGINPAEAKQIYRALTEDLRGTILDSGGPEALTSFDRANAIYAKIADRRAQLSKIIGVKADAAPERVMERMLQLAGSKGGADQTKLIMARRAIGPEKWDEVTSAAVNRMGRASPDSDFSGDRFVTAWNNLSERGKRTLFNSTGKTELARNVEDIMTLSKSYKNLAKMGNPSGTGRVNAIMSAIGAVTGALAGTVTIGLAAPLTMIGSIFGGRTVAAILSRPAAAKVAAQWSRSYMAAVASGSPGAISNLARTTQRLNEQVERLGIQGPVPVRANDAQQEPPRP